jgi:hypothetical protein
VVRTTLEPVRFRVRLAGELEVAHTREPVTHAVALGP